MPPVRSTFSLVCLVLAASWLGGCVSEIATPGPTIAPAVQADDAFTMPDGMRLPFRSWLPESAPTAVVLALHGINDSRDAWEIPAPDFAAAGIAVYAPDQRGFGATAARGFWPGGDALADDAATMARLLRARYPGVRLILLGESMGAAVLMHMATRPDPPDVDGYLLLAPAVWGRAAMNSFLRSLLWLASNTVPGMELTGQGLKVTPSDNTEALMRLSTDPLSLRRTRVDTVRGLVDLMDAALAAAPEFDAPALLMYGAKDELIPPRATAVTWHRLPPSSRRAFYSTGYHLLFRDLGRQVPIDDAIAWIIAPNTPLPSSAESAAAFWLKQQSP